jgi:hypothetical protein
MAAVRGAMSCTLLFIPFPFLGSEDVTLGSLLNVLPKWSPPTAAAWTRYLHFFLGDGSHWSSCFPASGNPFPHCVIVFLRHTSSTCYHQGQCLLSNWSHKHSYLSLLALDKLLSQAPGPLHMPFSLIRTCHKIPNFKEFMRIKRKNIWGMSNISTGT